MHRTAAKQISRYRIRNVKTVVLFPSRHFDCEIVACYIYLYLFSVLKHEREREVNVNKI